MITKTSLAAPSIRFKLMEAMLEAKCIADSNFDRLMVRTSVGQFVVIFIKPHDGIAGGFYFWHLSARGLYHRITKPIFKALREFGGDDYQQFCLENFSTKSQA